MEHDKWLESHYAKKDAEAEYIKRATVDYVKRVELGQVDDWIDELDDEEARQTVVWIAKVVHCNTPLKSYEMKSAIRDNIDALVNKAATIWVARQIAQNGLIDKLYQVMGIKP